MALFGFLFAAILTAGDPVPSAPPPSDWAFAKELAEMPAKLPPRVGEGRVPWTKDRISRCFFSPIKRPPFNRDELLDDVDYYPDGYLARLANEGVNGLWLTVRFRELVTCPYFPADPQAPRRLAKLRRTVAACAKHGIKVWLFAIEPTSMADDDPFLRAHPEIAGARSWDGRFVSCLSAPATLDYLRAATRDIFTRVPGLGGLIQITSGERPTTCFSELTSNASAVGCPRCRARTPAELHAALTGALVAGMRDAGSDARMISWFYHPQKRPERAPWVAECARNLPDGVTLQYNFESGATREQVGKTRRGGDYWLSVPGPAEPFRTVAAAARSAGRSLGAKIQVSCSHEVATVPYVPVPGLLYRKYRAMRAEGVESVMQCWFFGNCPGVMNRAAGELSFSDFSEDEDAFLLRLARAEWGEDAAAVSRLWKRFSDGYAQYPLSNLLQYYGPFHASVMATLLPDVSLGSQARTWKPNETPSGDLIGEALMDFTLEDALVQTELMCAPLEDPAVDAALAELGRKYAGDRDRRRDLGVMKALKILFVGARDVFAYYLARREGLFASRERGDAQAARTETAKMRTILARADRMTGEMKSLCADDSRLGFHSEAEAHLFTVEMLDWRLRALARSRQRLDAIERELQAGRPWPLSDRECETDVWQATRTATGEIVIEGTAPADGGDMEVRTYDLCGTCPAQVATGKADAKGRFRILLPKPSDDPRFRPAWIVIRRGGDFNNGGTKWIWPKRPEFPEPRLEQSRLTGDNFARLQVEGAPRAILPSMPGDPSVRVAWLKRCDEIRDRTAQGEYDVLLLGDGSVREGEPEGRTLDGGIAGECTENLLWRLDHGQLDGLSPKMIVLSIGTNNLRVREASQEPPTDTILGIQDVLNRLRLKFPAAKVVLHPVFPRGEAVSEPLKARADLVNSVIGRLADGRDVLWRGATVRPDDGPRTVTPAISMYWLANTNRAVRTRIRDKRLEQCANAGRDYDAVWLGDSITHFWEHPGKDEVFREKFGRYRILNAGFGGDRVENVLWNLRYGGVLDGVRARLVTLMIGTNNSWYDSAEDIAAGIALCVEEIRAKQPQAKVLLQSVLPREVAHRRGGRDFRRKRPNVDEILPKLKRVNELIRPLADGETVVFVDLFPAFMDADGLPDIALLPDGTHPGPEGLRVWADAVLPFYRQGPLADLSFDVPKVKPCKELSTEGLKGLWIESEKWKGRPTHVFGYLALPEGASATNRVPGIVLAHGGGGTAYPNWARTWASKGYAAIVVDTCGYLPLSKPTEGRVMSGVGGPAGWGRFDLGNEKPCDQWPYHAVAALVRAHSYLRSLPEVDAEKTGITGISWGGYLTMLAAATDRRYRFAMPVYACADFAAIDRECPFFTASRKLARSGALERWDGLFDAKHYAPKMDLPVFWFASSNDAAFPFDLLQRTVRMPKAMPGLAVRVNMRHSHGPHGENMPELFRFADSVVRGAPELPRVDEPVVRDGGVAVAFDPKGWEIARVDLNWCKDEVPAKGSVWQAERHPAPKGTRFEAVVPAGAKWLYVNVVLKGETGEKVYPESLVSSPAVRL